MKRSHAMSRRLGIEAFSFLFIVAHLLQTYTRFTRPLFFDFSVADCGVPLRLQIGADSFHRAPFGGSFHVERTAVTIGAGSEETLRV